MKQLNELKIVYLIYFFYFCKYSFKRSRFDLPFFLLSLNSNFISKGKISFRCQ